MSVKYELRFVAAAVAISTLLLICAHASASSLDDSPTALAALQAKADQAQPKDKCFLYAKLVSQMTDLAGRQFNSGDSGQASETLKLVQQYAEKIHMGVADDSKKLKRCRIAHAAHLFSPPGHPQRSFVRRPADLGGNAEAVESGSGAAHDAGLQKVGGESLTANLRT